MRILSIPLGVTLLLGVSAALAASTGTPTPENLSAAQKHRDDALVTLEAAKTTLTDAEAKLSKVKNKLDYEYRALDAEVSRRNHEEEAKLRVTIQDLKETRYELSAKRDRARLVVTQREAESEAADALCQVFELRSSDNGDPSQIRQWQKRHEKALARARRLQREVEAAQRSAG
jgi:vacuolar-type H+-ATPase subunit I/STV1